MNIELVKHYFGDSFENVEDRIKYYDFIENFITETVTDWSTAPRSSEIAHTFGRKLKELDEKTFSFLLSTSGYIPEFYTHDSSQETLYSKLIEVLICEWAGRIGFKGSSIQTQKASKEDVTIKIDNLHIVTDAKSFRLGRSQAAPNVKDTIKKGDYEKWLSHYEEAHRLGGLITFPSLHQWKKDSDAFLYVSDGSTKIAFMLYEQLAFMILKSIPHTKLMEMYRNYSTLFPRTSKSQANYFSVILKFLFDDAYNEYLEFFSLCSSILRERTNHELVRITEEVNRIKEVVRTEVESHPAEELRERLIKSTVSGLTDQILEQANNIRKFRPT